MVLGQSDFLPSHTFTAQTGVSVRFLEPDNDMMECIAQAFVTRDDQVDIFVFPAYAGLYTVKEKGYYLLLNADEALMRTAEELYPALRTALTAPNGDIVGWIRNVQPLVRTENTEVLQSLGINSPTTFEEFLDACHAVQRSADMGSAYKLADWVTYDAPSLMDWYMQQYLIASQLDGKRVDFSRPKFLTAIQRIRAELPPQPAGEEMEEGSEGLPPVFTLAHVFEAPSRSMLPMPKVLDDQPGGINVYANVLIINPFSAHKEQALDYLRFCAQEKSLDAYFIYRTLSEPTENPSVVEQMSAAQQEIYDLKGLTAPDSAQTDRMNYLAVQMERLTAQRWLAAPEDLQWYRQLSQGLFVSEDSPIRYDEQMRSMVAQYLAGMLDAGALLQGLQRRMDLTYREMGWIR